MKIVSITTIKNEADIIESFIRYHLNIVDEMIILNNGSTDDTNYILSSLVDEGLPLVVIEDKDKYFKPVQKMNFLLKKAINEHAADIVCPIDADEFLSCDSKNPREIIEKMNPFTYYKVKWRTYIPSENDEDEKFIPSKMKYIRDEELEEFKVIVTKELFKKYDVKLIVGSHDLSFNKKYKKEIKCEENNQLIMAHFPLRSINQTISKVLVSYPNLLCRIEVDPNPGCHRSHYAPMFFKIMEEGIINEEDVIEFSKRYSTKENNVDEDEEIIIKEKPMNISFCENLEIKYGYEIKPLSNILEHYLYLAKEINKFKKEEVKIKKENKKLKREVNKYKNSTSWKITASLRKIMNFIK